MAKILVVDDVPTQQERIRQTLQKAGMTVVTANDGDEVMGKVESEQPNLVILDIVMERMNGFEALRALRENENTKWLPIIMCSTKDTNFDKSWSLDCGADAYITKPFEPEQLVNIVQRLL